MPLWIRDMHQLVRMSSVQLMGIPRIDLILSHPLTVIANTIKMTIILDVFIFYRFRLGICTKVAILGQPEK
jgi:hypothetical protein